MRVRNKLDKYTPIIMLLPAVLGIAIVSVYPSLDAIRMSLFDIQLLKPESPFIGLGNYVTALSDPEFLKVILNTVFFCVVSLFLGAVSAMKIATQLVREYPGKALFRSIFLSPWVTPPLVTATVWRILLSENFGPVNTILLKLGLIDKPFSFLGSTTQIFGFLSIPMLVIIVINVWSIFPFMMVMFLAGLQTVPKELYEAAQMDGANKRQQFFRVTLPAIMPVVQTSILLEGIWQFNNFNISYLVAKGGPLNLTKLLAVEVYNQAFSNFKYGHASGVSVIMVLIVLIPSIFYIRDSLKKERG